MTEEVVQLLPDLVHFLQGLVDLCVQAFLGPRHEPLVFDLVPLNSLLEGPKHGSEVVEQAVRSLELSSEPVLHLLGGLVLKLHPFERAQLPQPLAFEPVLAMLKDLDLYLQDRVQVLERSLEFSQPQIPNEFLVNQLLLRLYAVGVTPGQHPL